MPSGVKIDSLKLANNTINETVTIEVSAKTSTVLSELGGKISGSQLFSNYQLKSSTNSPDGGDYPIKAAISLTINWRNSL